MFACLTFDVDAEAPILAESGLYARNLGVMSHQAYGPLVGVPRILDLLRENGAEDVLVVLGGTIPDDDAAELRRQGVAAVFGPGAPTSDIVEFLRR